jgi:hypothetical protein
MNAPEWVRQLVDSVADQITSLNVEGELGCHVYKNQSAGFDEWEITIFGEPVPMGGGRLAGYSVTPVFSIDALSVAALFDTPLSCRWQTGFVNGDDDLGPHLSVEGIQNGVAVWLRIVSEKPQAIPNDSPDSSRVRQK